MNGIDVHDYALEKPEAMTDALSEKLEITMWMLT